MLRSGCQLRVAVGTEDGRKLRLVDISVLLADYKRLLLESPPTVDGGADRGSGRFLHWRAADLRLGDLLPLLTEYRTLLAAR